MLTEKITEKFKKLIAEGQQIMAHSGWNGQYFAHHPSSADYLRFRTETLNLIEKVCGENSVHYSELKRISEGKDTANNSAYFALCYGTLYVEIEKAIKFPVVADPIWCGAAIKSVKWIDRGGKYPWSASVTPTSCGAWLGGGFQSGAWQELLDKTPKSKHWNKKSGTSEYWSMYNQYFCHADWAGGFKAPWNLEPARPNVGYLKTVNALCNPS